MAVYVLSDTHLSFSVGKPMDVFGARWNGHAEKIERGWNETVSDFDTVVIGGDVSWASSFEEAAADLDFIESLNGKKILLRGNHDYWWSTARKMNAFKAERGYGSISFLFNNAFNADGITVCGSRGWYNDKKSAPAGADYAKIVAREAGRLELSLSAGEKICEGREKVVFLHFPPVYADFVCEELIEVIKRHGVTRCYFGHIHGVYDMPPVTEYEGVSFYPAAADYLDFKPLLVD